ncbi:hypothetical protein EGR_03667 [Echinococcus granulosus]|uniref:Uncharacterized protein n=1 Tax=Echinococcus granulosus TaxID=6210 RepID=W6USM8_ECHGR|nr:hypothetical protein EGR_03667 [Echinococcus granulosus]EUB61377.1 hypothetical protein EGR_03667 [Echinococcus granulosus]
MPSMFDELPFVSAPDSDTASDSGNDRDSQKDRKWKCVPTNNPLRLRPKKSFDTGGTRSALLNGVEHRDQQSDIIFQ